MKKINNKTHNLMTIVIKKNCFLMIGLSLLLAGNAAAQVKLQGINTAPNVAGAFSGESLPRDSGFNNPLDLLNDFYPSVTVSLENHSNIRRRPDANESDNKIVVSPSLAYRTNIGRHSFFANYSGRFDRHSDFTQEDSDSNEVNLRLGLDLSKRWDLELFGALGNSREERGVSGTRDLFIGVDDGADIDDAPDRIDYDSIGFDLIYGKKLGRLKSVLGYERNSSGFRSESGSELAAGNRDRNSENVHFDIEYRVGGKTSVFARLDRDTIDANRFDDSFDSQQVSWLVGLRVKPTARLSGTIGYGRSDREFDDDFLNDVDTNNYYANVSYAITPYSILSLGTTRTFEEPASDDSSIFVSELFSLSWDHQLSGSLSFSSYVKSIDDDFDNGRRDEFFDWGFSFDYAAKHWLKLGVYYEDIERESNVSGVAFTDRIFGLRLNSDLRFLSRGQGGRQKSGADFFGSSRRSSTTQ